jgi:hypothetical integral membrane protein (TIGR02206 family)
MSRFEIWGPEHLAILAITFAVPLGLAVWARRDATGQRSRMIALGFAALLFVQVVGNLVFIGFAEKDRWQDLMPLQLCHCALFATAATCVWRHQVAYELAYFWGLAGTLQGLLTPGLNYGFPTPGFIFYFLGHSGIVAAILFLTAGLRLRPRARSIGRAYGWLLAYGAVAGTFNALFATNYGFLCEKPAAASLLSWFGPWPWYIGTLAVVALLNFVLLYLPWAFADRLHRPRPGTVASAS